MNWPHTELIELRSSSESKRAMVATSDLANVMGFNLSRCSLEVDQTYRWVELNCNLKDANQKSDLDPRGARMVSLQFSCANLLWAHENGQQYEKLITC